MAAVKKPAGEKTTTVEGQAAVGSVRVATAQERAAWEAQQKEPPTTFKKWDDIKHSGAISPEKGQAIEAAIHTFVQFDGVVVVHDTRGVEQLTDRAALGNPLGDHGLVVMSILLDGDWFEITAMGRVLGSDVARTYRVPLTNVRSARR